MKHHRHFDIVNNCYSAKETAMTYSCSDFTDTILEALAVNVPDESLDDPLAQANLALAEIRRLQAATRCLADFETMTSAEVVYCRTGKHIGEPMRNVLGQWESLCRDARKILGKDMP